MSDQHVEQRKKAPGDGATKFIDPMEKKSDKITSYINEVLFYLQEHILYVLPIPLTCFFLFVFFF